MCTKDENLSLHPKFDKVRRHVFSKIPMEGKVKPTILFFTLCFFFFIHCCSTQVNPSIQKGGIIYNEEYVQGPTYVNQQHYTLHRKADTSTLVQAVKFTRTLATQYETLCRETSHQVSSQEVQLATPAPATPEKSVERSWEVVVSTGEHRVLDAPGICSGLGGRLPEIRTVDDREYIRLEMIKAGIDICYAGVTYDSKGKIFRFNSDGANARTNSPFPYLQYGCNWGDANNAADWEWNHWVRVCANDFPVTYDWPDGTFAIRLADTAQFERQRRIICVKDKFIKVETKVTKEALALYKLSLHSCRRDEKSLTDSIEIVVHDIGAVTTLNMSALVKAQTSVSFFPQFVEDDTDAFDSFPNYQADEPNVTELPVTEAPQVLHCSERSSPPRSERSSAPLPEFSSLPEDLTDDFGLHTQLEELQIARQDLVLASRAHQLALTNPELQLIFDDESVDLPVSLFDKVTSSPHWDAAVAHPDPQSEEFKKLQHAVLYHFHDILQGHRIQLIDEIARLRRETADLIARTLEIHKSNDYIARNLQDFPAPIEAPIAVGQPLSGTDYSSSHNLSRHIRAIGLLPVVATTFGGTMVGNAISSAYSGDAPLSWFGDTLGPLFGFATKKEVKRQFDHITHISTEVQALKMGGLELEKAVNAVNKRVDHYGEVVISGMKATMTLMMEMDLKALARYMIVLLTANTNKYSNLYLAASNGKNVPSGLSPSELKAVADRVKADKGIVLSTDLRQVGTLLMVVDNEIQLIFKVPILDDNQLFHFYSVLPIPIFSNDTTSGNITTLVPELDAEYIGISKSGTSYIVVSSAEFSRCTTTPHLCQISSPILPMNKAAHCIVSTYVSDKLTCPLVEVDSKPIPFMHIKNNVTIYSMPEPTALFIKCADPSSLHQYRDETVVLKGMGTATFRSGCTATFPDGTHFNTPSFLPSEELPDLKLFNLLRTYPIPTGVRIRRLAELPHAAPLSLQEYRIPSWDEVKRDAFHPVKAIPFIVKFGCTVALLIAIGLFFFCYWRRCRVNCSRLPFCACCAPPPDPNDHFVAHNRLDILVEKFNRLQTHLKDNLSKFSGSTASMFGARSTPNLYHADPEKGSDYPLKMEMLDHSLPVEQPTVTIDKNRVRFSYKAETPAKPPPILKNNDR